MMQPTDDPTPSSAIPGPSSPQRQQAQVQQQPLGLFIQPACLHHRYIRHPNASHIFERPERLRAVLLGVAAGVARLEATAAQSNSADQTKASSSQTNGEGADDLSGLLSSLSLNTSFLPPSHIAVVPPPTPPLTPGNILLHHPAVQIVHSPTPEAPFPFLGAKSAGFSGSSGSSIPQSSYLKDLFKWASEAVEKIKETGSEIPQGLGLNQGDLYLGPGSILAIEGAIQTVCQAIDNVCQVDATPLQTATKTGTVKAEPSTPPNQRSQAYEHGSSSPESPNSSSSQAAPSISKAFCVIRPPGHHCGEDAPSGFCYINNVVVAAMHAYLQHDVDRAIIIDFDLHHGNGTQALVMPLNAASHVDDLQVKAGKPVTMFGKDGKPRRGWKGFYGSVHDIYSYPCEDGDLDLVKDASISLAAHGQYIENIHLQPYTSEADFYERIYPLYLALLDKARVYMDHTQAEASRTIVLISAGFDACEHEHQGMQRHDRRVPTSFFSRYTKDIVAFADKYTEGKVVSVLEGGYSDRALTSAAMGHVVGMRGELPKDCNEWWTEPELVNLEKATKKRRTGKLAPFPAELSSYPHLARTHALLGHFEGSASDSVAPSVANTPQHGAVASRMTLRDRRKPEIDPNTHNVETTPPARRAVRGRGAASAASTPRNTASSAATTTPTAQSKTTKATTPAAKASRALKVDEDAIVPALLQSKIDGALSQRAAMPEVVDEEVRKDDSLDAAVRDLAAVSLASADASQADQQTAAKQSPIPPAPSWPAPNPLIPSSDIAQSTSTSSTVPSGSIPKIILRIPRPQPLPSSSSADPPSSTSHVYPSLPPTAQIVQNPIPVSHSHPQLDVEDRMAYREGSASSGVTDGSASNGTETEYASAQSGLGADTDADEDGRNEREGTGSTLSSGPELPGGYGGRR